MAERRMFAKTIIDSDAFLDMPLSTQALYFHLSMRADDEGFINNPKKLQRMVGSSDDDLKVLIAKNFIIPFDSGVVVIKHWKIHNYIRNDRFKQTVYQEEKKMLGIKNNQAYTIEIQEERARETVGIPNGYQMDTQYRIGKDRLGEVRIDKDNIKGSDEPTGRAGKRFKPPTLEEVQAYCDERCNNVNPEAFIDFYSSKGWMIGKNKMTDWKAAVRNWERTEKTERKPNSKPTKADELNSFYNMASDWAEGGNND